MFTMNMRTFVLSKFRTRNLKCRSKGATVSHRVLGYESFCVQIWRSRKLAQYENAKGSVGARIVPQINKFKAWNFNQGLTNFWFVTGHQFRHLNKFSPDNITHDTNQERNGL